MYKKPTKEAIMLKEALEKEGVYSLIEFYDGHKHIDLAVPKGKIDIEIDGNQHYTNSKQIVSDLSRAHYSDLLGYDTIHIPNISVLSEVDKIARALAEASEAREKLLHSKFMQKYTQHDILEGTIVENSLRDKSILHHLHVIKTWRAGDWTLLSIKVHRAIANDLGRYMNDGPWYIHLWEEGKDDVVVVFKNKTFLVKHFDKSTWTDAVEYGKSIGIPDGQMNFVKQ